LIECLEINLKSALRNFKFAILLCAMLLALCVPAEAQQPGKIPRIGFLIGSSPSANAARIEAFRHGLRELGYVEGKNIVIEFRSAEGQFDRLPDLAAEIVRLKVDVIVTSGPIINRPAKEATSTIPIVMGFDNDPVGNGFVASLARPGGNMTGLANLAPEITGKQLELLKEIVPRLSRVAVFGNSKEPSNPQLLTEAESAAEAFRIKLQYLDVLSPKYIETAFQAARTGRADALLILGAFIFNPHRGRRLQTLQ
jgi:putative tryptophan/tyrosine transport system substrate-binding protein